MKIGDEVYIHGFVDEIRKDTVIIRNDGGYFGTVESEVCGEAQERKKGKWIDTGSGQECSVCHEIQYGYDTFRHYCANCGAAMKGE